MRAALCWLAPSGAAACAGALAAGLFEGRGVAGGALATAGFVALLAVPVLAVASALVRAVARAWRTRALVEPLVDADGAAPRLAGWVAVIWLGVFALGAAMYESVWALSAYTAFHPLIVSMAEPVVAVVAALATVGLSRPAARLLGWIAGRIDTRWRRGRRRTLLRPRIIVATACLTALAAIYALWRAAVQYRLGPVDTSLLHAPAAGLAAAGVMHAVWRGLGRARVVVGVTAAVATAAVVVLAIAAAFVRPGLTLEIWGDRPLAGLAIETAFDTDAIHDRIAFAELAPAARPGAAHPDIVLITIDTVRADHTPPYGGQAEMPALRDLAARGAVFDWAFAPGNVTRRSIPSIVLGLSPNRVRGRVVGWALRVDPRHVLLAERLRAGGYDTAGFMCCEGFWGPQFRTGLERGLTHLEIDHRGATLAARARAWITARDQRAAAPLFVWMHLLEPHNWLQGTGEPRNDADRRTFYDRALATADRAVADLLAAFHRRAPDRMPIVIVTADHGEALGEHGQPFHSTDLYNSQIRVPLVIAGSAISPQRIAETVSLTDLVPTILDLAGFTPPHGPGLDGRSLADLATGARPSDPDAGVAFAAMIKDRSNPGGITAVVRGRWKLIDSGGVLELYDTRADPDERTNAIGREPAVAADLRKLLDERTAAADISPFE